MTEMTEKTPMVIPNIRQARTQLVHAERAERHFYDFAELHVDYRNDEARMTRTKEARSLMTKH